MQAQYKYKKVTQAPKRYYEGTRMLWPNMKTLNCLSGPAVSYRYPKSTGQGYTARVIRPHSHLRRTSGKLLIQTFRGM